MDAMLFAAGLGTRLRPITDSLPKALVEVAGVPMLERAARRLIAAGADRLIINVHAFADQVERFVQERDGFGVEVRISREPEAPLETGGGLLAAEPLFRKNAPFFLHNTDIVTNVPLEAVYAAHAGSGARGGDGGGDGGEVGAGGGGRSRGPGESRTAPLATLVVQERESSRRLIFDRAGLCGRENLRSDELEWVREPAGDVLRLPFSGIHVVSPAIFELLTERGAFSIMDAYLRLAGAGHRIQPFDAGDALWLEIGNPERLRRAEEVAVREGL